MTALLAAALALTLHAAAPRPPAADPVVTKYVPAGFCAALVIDPVRLDKAATAAGLPVADLWKAVEEKAGLDPRKLHRATLFVDPLPGGNVAFFPAVAIRYPAGTDARKQLTPLLGGDAKEAKAGDQSYLRSGKYQLAKTEIAGYAADDRTLLFAPWPTLETMLKAGDAKDRPLAAALAAADLDHEMVLVIVPGPVMKKVAELEKGSTNGTPALDPFRPALKHLRAVVVTADLGRETLVRAEFVADDAEGAAVVRATVEKLLARAKESYPATRKGLETDLPASVVTPLRAVLDAAVTGHKLTTDGAKVVLTVPRPKELAPKK